MSASDLNALSKKALIFAREYANPNSTLDGQFTTARHKDFFDGHSWAEGYDFSGRVNMWINQQSGGEAVNSYYAVYPFLFFLFIFLISNTIIATFPLFLLLYFSLWYNVSAHHIFSFQ